MTTVVLTVVACVFFGLYLVRRRSRVASEE
jgi:hypothetical protein